jgi:hypothetical protein
MSESGDESKPEGEDESERARPKSRRRDDCSIYTCKQRRSDGVASWWGTASGRNSNRAKESQKQRRRKKQSVERQKKRDSYETTEGWLYDDGKQLQVVVGSELTAEGVKRMPEWKIRTEGTRGRRTAVALRGGCLSRMIAARNIPMTQAWMKRKRKIALNKSKSKRRRTRRRGSLGSRRRRKKWRKRKKGLSGLTTTEWRYMTEQGQGSDAASGVPSAHVGTQGARRDGTLFLRVRFPGCREVVAWLDQLLTTKGNTPWVVEQIATKEALACSRQELKGVRRNGDRKVKGRKADGGDNQLGLSIWMEMKMGTQT